jgi:hypothetical protein
MLRLHQEKNNSLELREGRKGKKKKRAVVLELLEKKQET